MSNPFSTLQPWLIQILHTIKREIKSEHLSKDPSFYRAHFGNRPQNRLTTEEIIAAYSKELLGGNEPLSEWVINRWVFQHGEIYRHFAEKLTQIRSDFSEIQSLTEEESAGVLSGSIPSFGALPTYIFSVLNGVVFPENVLQSLRVQAEQEGKDKAEELFVAAEKETLEQIQTRHAREMARLQEKYEDKIAGVMKKYTIDVEALKKQIRALQQRMHDRAAR